MAKMNLNFDIHYENGEVENHEISVDTADPIESILINPSNELALQQFKLDDPDSGHEARFVAELKRFVLAAEKRLAEAQTTRKREQIADSLKQAVKGTCELY